MARTYSGFDLVSNISRRGPQQNKLSFVSALGIASALVSASNIALCADWSAVPYVELRAGWSDNLFLDNSNQASNAGRENEIDSTFGRAVAGVDIFARTQIDLFQLGMEVDYSAYSENVGADSGQQSIDLRYRHSGQRHGWGVAAAFDRDSIITAQREPADIPGFASEEIDLGSGDFSSDDAGLVTADGHRERIVVRPTYEFSVSEKTKIRGRYSYNDLGYAGVPAGLFNEFSRNTIDLGIEWLINPTDTIGVTILSGGFERDDGASETDTLGLTLSYQRALREDLYVFGWVEGMRNETTFNTGPGTSAVVESDDPAFEFGFRKKFRQSELSIQGGRTLQASSTGNLVLRDGIRASFSRDMSVRSAMNLDAYTFKSESLDLLSAQSTEQEYRRFEASVSWLWTQQLTLTGGYEYTWRQLNGEVDSSDDNTVFLAVRWQGLDRYGKQ